MPGMVSTGLEGEEHEQAAIPEVKCHRPVVRKRVVDIDSPRFSHGKGLHLTAISSEVEVRPTASLAGRRLAYLRASFDSALVRPCLERAVRDEWVRALSRGRTHFALGRANLSALSTRFPNSYGIRVLIPYTATRGRASIRARFCADYFVFISGPAEVNLRAETAWGCPSAATERHLLSLLHSRARS
jgi:hypothetical protein